MFKAIANFFKRGEDKALISADENVVKKEFKKKQFKLCKYDLLIVYTVYGTMSIAVFTKTGMIFIIYALE